MEKYLEQLIEDLREAHSRAPQFKVREDMTEQDILDELREIDRMIHEEPPNPFKNIFGLNPDLFPPAHMLTSKQAEHISEEILFLWSAFNIEPVYPDNFPLANLYPLLVQKFKEPFLYFPGGITGLELCSYDPSQCPFGDDFCSCKETQNILQEYDIKVKSE